MSWNHTVGCDQLHILLGNFCFSLFVYELDGDIKCIFILGVVIKNIFENHGPGCDLLESNDTSHVPAGALPSTQWVLVTWWWGRGRQQGWTETEKEWTFTECFTTSKAFTLTSFKNSYSNAKSKHHSPFGRYQSGTRRDWWLAQDTRPARREPILGPLRLQRLVIVTKGCTSFKQVWDSAKQP